MKNKSCEIKNGVLYLKGKSVFLFSADYPYYRDQKVDWERQLTSIKKMGIRCVTFYIPWRHHMPDDPLIHHQKYDFGGKRESSTDIKCFLSLCQKLQLLVIAKPGPFVHAELNLGGLPDYVQAGNGSGIEPITDFYGTPAAWSNIKGNSFLPAPLDKKYLKYVEIWLSTVAREIIVPNQYPQGPIIAVQILNEGIYCDGNQHITGYDYSSSATYQYQLFLKTKYKSMANLNKVYDSHFKNWQEIQPPRVWQEPNKKNDIIKYIDWSEFSSLFIPLVIKEYKKYMQGVKVPFLTNINPPQSDRLALEAYFVRNNPKILEKIASSSYGYTNWLRVIYNHWEDYCHYRLIAKKARGMCLEENWGFSKLYDPAYEFCQPSYFQSMTYIAFGATGLNIYTAASTNNWSKGLDALHKPPYPHSAPIKEDGNYRQKFWTVYQMSSFFNQEGPKIVRDTSLAKVAWGLYTPYSEAFCWQQDVAQWNKAGFNGACSGIVYGWDSFLKLLAKNDTESDLVFLKEDRLSCLLKYKMIFTNGFDWMDNATQKKLVNYIRNGGILVLTGLIPYLDEKMEEGKIIKETIFSLPSQKIDRGFVTRYGKGVGVYLDFIPWLTADNIWENEGLVEKLMHKFNINPTTRAFNNDFSPEVDVTQYDYAPEDRQYIFVINREKITREHKITYTGKYQKQAFFKINMCADSVAVVGIKSDKISSAFLKCINDHENIYTKPYLNLNDKILAAGKESDLVLVDFDKYYELSITNLLQTDDAEVILPFSFQEVASIVEINDSQGKQAIKFEGIELNVKFQAGDLNKNFTRYRIVLKKTAAR